MDKELNEVLEKKFLCPSKFAQDIEKIVSQSDDINYIEAIIVYCEENKIELETVPKLLSKPLKEKLKFNAMELNFLKRSSRAEFDIYEVMSKLNDIYEELMWPTDDPFDFKADFENNRIIIQLKRDAVWVL